MNSFEILVNELTKRNLTVSAAESCTGGLFASGVVSVADASRVIASSFVTYSVDAKIKLVNVSKESVEEFGVVSEKVALEMAKGAMLASEADCGVGITGYAGPAADEFDTTAGVVCFGFCVKEKTLTATKHFGNAGRNVVREAAAIYAADTLTKLIKVYGDIK